MSYQVLARKYRPQKFSEVIGQEHVTQTLKNALEQGRTAHGYIFSGHRGIGKTTVARILAMALNCRSSDKPVTEPCGVCESCTEIRAGNSVDVIEIDAATNRGIDEIRELREATRYRPARDRFKIYILDEAHQITDAAFNALLKTLEEPPSHVVFMLATTQPEDIPQTIRSRCQHFSFRAVRFEEILNQLKDLCGREKIEADEDALALLAEAGDGSMRDALSILDQAIASATGRLTAEQVRNLVGAAPSGVLEEVMQGVARGSSEEVLRLVDRLIGEGHSPTHFPAADFERRTPARGSRGGIVLRGGSGAASANHAAHSRRIGLPAGATLSSGTGPVEDGACAALAAHRATAQRCWRCKLAASCWSARSRTSTQAAGSACALAIRDGLAVCRGFGAQERLQTRALRRKRPALRITRSHCGHHRERCHGLGGSGHGR
jgi:DNA polymerase-3 subunit gamma/tau